LKSDMTCVASEVWLFVIVKGLLLQRSSKTTSGQPEWRKQSFH
jgi:hypothetical protein